MEWIGWRKRGNGERKGIGIERESKEDNEKNNEIIDKDWRLIRSDKIV